MVEAVLKEWEGRSKKRFQSMNDPQGSHQRKVSLIQIADFESQIEGFSI
jgi:hypothetical protein